RGSLLLIRNSCAAIAQSLRRRGHRRGPLSFTEYHNGATEWARGWLAADLAEVDRKKVQDAITKEWEERWRKELGRSQGRRRHRADESSDKPPTKDRLGLHKGLRKAESSLLVQMRTRKIGLRAFLFERQVPDIASPICFCGDGRETATHVAAYCLQEGGARRELPFAMQ